VSKAYQEINIAEDAGADPGIGDKGHEILRRSPCGFQRVTPPNQVSQY
jgi:hypothetical protein